MSVPTWAAPDYRRFRPPVPAPVVRRLVGAAARRDHALDVGCGTGQVTFALSRHFTSVIGADSDEAMLSEARRAALDQVVHGVQFRQSRAPELGGIAGTFDLITFCRSFHWMDRPATLARIRGLLHRSSRVAIMGDGTFWTGETSWEKALKALIQSYLGEQRRGAYQTPLTSHEDELLRAGYAIVSNDRFRFDRKWTVSEALGCLRGTSYANPSLFADYEAFKADAERLLRNEAALTEHVAFHVIVAEPAGDRALSVKPAHRNDRRGKQ